MIGEGAARVRKTIKLRLGNRCDVDGALGFEVLRLQEGMRAIEPHLKRRRGSETASDQDETDEYREADAEGRLARDAGKRMTQEPRACETRHWRAIPLK